MFGFFKKRLVKFSKLSQFFQSKKQQSFCISISAIISKVFVKIDYILKKNMLWKTTETERWLSNKDMNKVVFWSTVQ